MSLFHRRESAPPLYPPEEYEPVLRSSICTGEKTACMRNRSTGKILELQLIRSQRDLEDFCRTYGVKAEDLKTVY